MWYWKVHSSLHIPQVSLAQPAAKTAHVPSVLPRRTQGGPRATGVPPRSRFWRGRRPLEEGVTTRWKVLPPPLVTSPNPQDHELSTLKADAYHWSAQALTVDHRGPPTSTGRQPSPIGGPPPLLGAVAWVDRLPEHPQHQPGRSQNGLDPLVPIVLTVVACHEPSFGAGPSGAQPLRSKCRRRVWRATSCAHHGAQEAGHAPPVSVGGGFFMRTDQQAHPSG
jgi:hypothetical protein